MSNPFEELLSSEQVSDSLKSKVMKDIEIIKLSLELADLFVIKYPESIASIFNNYNNN